MKDINQPCSRCTCKETDRMYPPTYPQDRDLGLAPPPLDVKPMIWRGISFRPFTADLAPQYGAYYDALQSDACTASLACRLAWDCTTHYLYTVLEDCLCFVSLGLEGMPAQLDLPMGQLTAAKLEKIVETLFPLLAPLPQNNLGPQSIRVSSVDEKFLPLFEGWKTMTYEASMSRDFSDYVYDAEKLRTLGGKKYRAKRNANNQFWRTYPDTTYRSLTADDAPEALALVARWVQEKRRDLWNAEESDYWPIQRLFAAWDDLPDIRGGALFWGDQMIAFSIGSEVRPDYAIMHFEKADNERFPGLYAVINQVVQQEEFPTVNLVNREEDLGLENLRQAKESYMPVSMVDKYEVAVTLRQPGKMPGEVPGEMPEKAGGPRPGLAPRPIKVPKTEEGIGR